MYRNFEEIEAALFAAPTKGTVVLAGATDDIALAAVVRAVRAGVVSACLVGKADETRRMLKGMGEDPARYEVIDAPTENKAARAAMKEVVAGNGRFPMKGLMQTGTFLLASKMEGVVAPDALVNEATAFRFPGQDRLMVVGDCAVNQQPCFDEKVRITENLISLARVLGADTVRVAALSVLEKVDPKLQSSVDARNLAERDWGKGVVVEGPLALDAVLDGAAAAHKGIASDVAGKADVVVVPDLHAGNVLHKCIHYFGRYPYASALLGALVPVVMTSRTDNEDSKYNSILLAALQAGA